MEVSRSTQHATGAPWSACGRSPAAATGAPWAGTPPAARGTSGRTRRANKQQADFRRSMLRVKQSECSALDIMVLLAHQPTERGKAKEGTITFLPWSGGGVLEAQHERDGARCIYNDECFPTHPRLRPPSMKRPTGWVHHDVACVYIREKHGDSPVHTASGYDAPAAASRGGNQLNAK